MDDYLGTGITDEKEEVPIAFESDAYTDEDDLPLWKVDSLPDLYVMVYNAKGEVILTTRQETQENQLPDQLVVRVPEEVARMNGML